MIRVNLAWLMKLLERRFMKIELLLEYLPLSREQGFRKSFSLHLLVFKCLQLKTINVRSVLFGGGMFCSPPQASSGLAGKVMQWSFNVRAGGTHRIPAQEQPDWTRTLFKDLSAIVKVQISFH